MSLSQELAGALKVGICGAGKETMGGPFEIIVFFFKQLPMHIMSEDSDTECNAA